MAGSMFHFSSDGVSGKEARCCCRNRGLHEVRAAQRGGGAGKGGGGGARARDGDVDLAGGQARGVRILRLRWVPQLQYACQELLIVLASRVILVSRTMDK